MTLQLARRCIDKGIKKKNPKINISMVMISDISVLKAFNRILSHHMYKDGDTGCIFCIFSLRIPSLSLYFLSWFVSYSQRSSHIAMTCCTTVHADF